MTGPSVEVGGRAVSRVVQAAMVVVAARGAVGLEDEFEEALNQLEMSLRDVWALRAEGEA